MNPRENGRTEGIGLLLRDLRTSRQMSLRGLAKAASISPGTVSHWETEKVSPRIPELEAVLEVLRAPLEVRQEVYARINAPRALARLREEATSSPAPQNPLPFPASGDLLRALRQRRGISQEQAAALLRVQPSAISRWEQSKSRPSESRLEAYCQLLGADREEQKALTRLSLTPSRLDDSPLPLDAQAMQIEQLRQDAVRGETALMDLRFLSLEASLRREAERQKSAWSLCAKTYTWHAQWLLWQHRLPEAGQTAQRALDIAPQAGPPERFWFRAAHILANYLVDGPKRPNPTRGAQLILDWLPMARWPDTEAWMYHTLATYLFRAGKVEAALAAIAHADESALRSENPTAIRNSGCDSAVILLKVGRNEEARARLTTAAQPNLYHRVYEAQTWMNALLALGEETEAQKWFQSAQALRGTHLLPSSYTDPFLLRFGDLP